MFYSCFLKPSPSSGVVLKNSFIIGARIYSGGKLDSHNDMVINRSEKKEFEYTANWLTDASENDFT
jgi:hypothetical protein